MSDEDIDAKIAELLTKAQERNILKRESNIVKRADITTMPDIKKQVSKMTSDGFSTAEIALALGFDESQVAILLEETNTPDSPESILQTNLMRLHALVPLADATYRNDPNFRNALAVTGIIDSVTKTITEMHNLKEKEEVYALIVQKVLQPVIRNMISDMMTEFRYLTNSLDKAPDKKEESLQEAAMAIGKKFEESYRKSTEMLASVIGLNSEARARVLARIAMQS